MLGEGGCWTLSELVENVGISGSKMLRILRQGLRMPKIAVKWVPHTFYFVAIIDALRDTPYQPGRIEIRRGQYLKPNNCDR